MHAYGWILRSFPSASIAESYKILLVVVVVVIVVVVVEEKEEEEEEEEEVYTHTNISI